LAGKSRRKPHSSFRLSGEAKEILRELAKGQGVSLTAMLEILIRDGRKGRKG
jgi:hypothetical protein